MRVVGLVGRARAGKDSVADALCGMGWRRVSLAEPVKWLATDLFGLPPRAAWGRNGYDRERVLPEWGLSVREILQRLGTEVGRSVHADVWVRYAARVVAALPPETPGVVVSDVRFPNEVAWVRSYPNGEVWRVERDDVPEVAAHASEALASDPDFRPDLVLRNDGSLAELHLAAQHIARRPVQHLDDRVPVFHARPKPPP